MRQLKHIVALCLSLSAATLALANGEWHERAERAGQIPSFPETTVAASVPRGYGQPEGYQRGKKQKAQASTVAPQRIDWLVVATIALWLVALLFLVITVKTLKQSKHVFRSDQTHQKTLR